MPERLLCLLGGLPGRNMNFRAGAAVFRIGNPVRSVHIIRGGRIHLIRHQADGTSLILQRAEEGSVLAEASLHSSRYHCDAIAETDSVTWAMPRDELKKHLREDPALTEAWLQHLAREVQTARLHAEILSLKTVAARLDTWIAWHGPVPEKGRWIAIAQQIGVSPEALYRELSRRRVQTLARAP
jgi:CRP/FNR family transcriptional regulator, dissimilatory nitrate respiration regulator